MCYVVDIHTPLPKLWFFPAKIIDETRENHDKLKEPNDEIMTVSSEQRERRE